MGHPSLKILFYPPLQPVYVVVIPGDYSARLPGGQALGWTTEESSADHDEGQNKLPRLLGILTDLLPCKQP